MFLADVFLDCHRAMIAGPPRVGSLFKTPVPAADRFYIGTIADVLRRVAASG
jgi:hypothetical protein